MDPAHPSYSTNNDAASAVPAPSAGPSLPPPPYASASSQGAFRPVPAAAAAAPYNAPYTASSANTEKAGGAYPSPAAAAAAAPAPYPTPAGSYSASTAAGPYPYPTRVPLLTDRTVVTVERSEGFLDRQKLLIPLMPLWLSIVLFIINTFLPGIGTIIAGLCAPCTDPGRAAGSRIGSLCANFWIGLAQLILAPIVIGWLWSIFWGVLFVTQSLDRGSTTVTTITPHGRSADITQTRTDNIGSGGVQVTTMRQSKVVDYGTNNTFGV